MSLSPRWVGKLVLSMGPDSKRKWKYLSSREKLIEVDRELCLDERRKLMTISNFLLPSPSRLHLNEKIKHLE